MHTELIVTVVLGVLGLRGLRSAQSVGCVLLTAGAVVELVGGSITVLGLGGLLVALGGSIIVGRGRASHYALFGVLFLFLLAGSILAAFARTDQLQLFRVGLGLMPSRWARGASSTLWFALLLRLTLLPALLSVSGRRAAVASIGPAWWSGAVLLARFGGVLPQAFIDGCQPLCRMVSLVVVIMAGILAFRAFHWNQALGSIGAGVGALAAAGAWFGGDAGVAAGKTLVMSTALACCAVASLDTPAGLARSAARVIHLLVLGFPLGGGFAGRLKLMGVLADSENMSYVAMLVFWVFPLVSAIRGINWGEAVHRQPAWYVWGLLTLGTVGALLGGPLTPWYGGW